jgi:hypothetical protein
MPALRHLPDGYAETQHIVLTEPGTYLRLNLLALIPMGIALLLMAIWSALLPASSSGAGPEWWLSVVLVLVLVLPLHELIHGVAIQRIGHRVRYGIRLDKGVLFATADDALFRRGEYIFVALLPLVAITLAGMALLPLVPDGWRWTLVIGVVLNAGGAVGDVWSVWVLLRHPPGVIVRDEGDSFRIYNRAD